MSRKSIMEDLYVAHMSLEFTENQRRNVKKAIKIIEKNPSENEFKRIIDNADERMAGILEELRKMPISRYKPLLKYIKKSNAELAIKENMFNDLKVEREIMLMSFFTEFYKQNIHFREFMNEFNTFISEKVINKKGFKNMNKIYFSSEDLKKVYNCIQTMICIINIFSSRYSIVIQNEDIARKLCHILSYDPNMNKNTFIGKNNCIDISELSQPLFN